MEQLEYFSFDPSAAGTRQTFSFNLLDGDMLYQSGKLNIEKYPDYDIQEFYQRVEPGMSDGKKRHPLVGCGILKKPLMETTSLTSKKNMGR